MTDNSDTVEVDREYLWALEVLATDSINEAEILPSVYLDALGIARDANLKQPRDRYNE